MTKQIWEMITLEGGKVGYGCIYYNEKEDEASAGKPKAVVEFKGFGGGNMELRITRMHTEPSYRDHDHIEIWKDGKYLKYMHILKDGDVDVY